jgi:hypothetical protein
MHANRERRRQKMFNRTVLAATVIIIVVATAYAVTRPTTSVTLPPYLNKCILLKGPWEYSESFWVFIVIGGRNVTVPGGIGFSGGTCVRPIFTLTDHSGGVHIDAPEQRTYTLGDFFTVWGSTFGHPNEVFDRDHLFSYTADTTHHISMTVNNETNTDYQNYVLPINADPQFNPYKIVITYG